jgi:hypothetical protein
VAPAPATLIFGGLGSLAGWPQEITSTIATIMMKVSIRLGNMGIPL